MSRELFENAEKHDSFGMVGISHVSGNAVLVGSEFQHQHFVSLHITRAEKHRDLSREWWFGREELIEVWLSEAQFVELISRPNIGQGVPCTLRRVDGETMPDPPQPKPMRERFRKDLKEDCKACVSDLRGATKELKTAIDEGRIGKAALREIARKLELAAKSIDDGIPFVEKQFEEAMEATVHHAAAEIEATVTQTAIRLGLEQMRQLSKEAPKLIEAPTENTEEKQT